MMGTAVMIVDRRLCVRQAYRLDPLDRIQGVIACKLAEIETAGVYTRLDSNSDSMIEIAVRRRDGDSDWDLCTCRVVAISLGLAQTMVRRSAYT
jgi:hypothetical protein